MGRPQIVIDTNVLVSAQLSRRGASSKLVSLIGTAWFDVYVSVPLVLEYEDVLLRSHEKLGLTQDDVGDLIDAICALSKPRDIHFLWRPYLRDEKDEFVLELAVAAQCDHIITFNHQDFRAVEKFGITILDPGTFLRSLGALP